MIIEVKQGKLEGLIEKSVLTGKEYFSFLGIPYAKPPVGDLRFQVTRVYFNISIRRLTY